MSEQLTIGRIAFERTAPRVLRVVKSEQQKPEYNLRRHGIAMLKELVALYPKDAVEIVREIVLDKRK